MSSLEITRLAKGSIVEIGGLMAIQGNLKSERIRYRNYGVEKNDAKRFSDENAEIIRTIIEKNCKELETEISNIDEELSKDIKTYKLKELYLGRNNLYSADEIKNTVDKYNKLVLEIRKEIAKSKNEETVLKKSIKEKKELLAGIEKIKSKIMIETLKKEIDIIDKEYKEVSRIGDLRRKEMETSLIADKYKKLISDNDKLSKEYKFSINAMKNKSEQIIAQIHKIGVEPGFENQFVIIQKEQKTSRESGDYLDVEYQIMKSFLCKIVEFASQNKIAHDIDLSDKEEVKYNIKAQFDEKKSILLREIEIYYTKIKEIDKECYESLKKITEEADNEVYIERVKIIRDNIKIKYADIKEKNGEKEAINSTLEIIKSRIADRDDCIELREEMNRFIQNKNYNRNEYAEFVTRQINKIAEIERVSSVKSKVKNILSDMGYKIAEEAVKKIDSQEFIPLDDNGYNLMMDCNKNGELVTRVVKFVGSEDEKKNVGTYQKQKDKEAVKKWCVNYDKMIDVLKSDGYQADTVLRKEADMEDVMYIVNNDIEVEKNEIKKSIEIINSRSIK